MSDTQTLRVDGMTCASCTARIERLLAREDGVTGVRANLMTSSVAVDGLAEPALLADDWPTRASPPPRTSPASPSPA